MRISDWSSDVCSSDLMFDLARSSRLKRIAARQRSKLPLIASPFQRAVKPRRPPDATVQSASGSFASTGASFAASSASALSSSVAGAAGAAGRAGRPEGAATGMGDEDRKAAWGGQGCPGVVVSGVPGYYKKNKQ